MYKVKVENLNQFEIVLSSKDVSEIILSRDSFAEPDLPKLVNKIKKAGKLAWILMERISRYEETMKTVGADTIRPRRGEHCEPASLRLSTDKIYDIKNLDGIIIQNLDSFAYMLRKINKAANEKLKVELNYTMNCYNAETKLVHENLYNEKRKNASEVPLLFTAPVELNTYELSEVGYDTIIAYSYIDTMVTANCLRKNTFNNMAIQSRSHSSRLQIAERNAGADTICHKPVGADTIRPHRRGELREPANRRGELREPACKYKFNYEKIQDFSSYIIDRKGKKLHYKTYCKYCYNKIFNVEPLYLLDKIEELLPKICRDELSEHVIRIDFSFENDKEVRNILNKKIPESFTRGHIKTSIK